MVRILGILAGLAMVFVAIWSFGHGAYSYLTTKRERNVVEEFHKAPKPLHLASDGPFGKFDRQQVQRGLQIYTEVCSSCHSLNYVAFRNLEELGYNEAEVKGYATGYKTPVPDIDPKTGEAAGRKAIPADHFPSPYLNEVAARQANNNQLPPDLSLITKAREGGAAYVYSLLTGYQDPPRNLPADNRPGPNLHYNPYFANLNIAMPPPLRTVGQVEYKDGTKPTVNQMAQDVAAFLTWTAEPRLENRHRTGLAAVLFLLFLTVLGYFAYQNIWHGPASRAVRRTGPLDPENMAKRDAANAEAGTPSA
jgi:ubiquinol-cytochrome c reductase cytochrome c1 subunit